MRGGLILIRALLLVRNQPPVPKIRELTFPPGKAIQHTHIARVPPLTPPSSPPLALSLGRAELRPWSPPAAVWNAQELPMRPCQHAASVDLN